MKDLILKDVIRPHPKKGLYFDFTSIINSIHLSNIAEQLYRKISKFNPDAIIGFGYGGTQLCGAITALFGIPSIIVRTFPHQKQNRQIEGDIDTPKRIVIIDDAIYSGDSIRAMLQIIGDKVSKIVGAGVIYDDWRPLGTCQIEQSLWPIISLVNKKDISYTRDATPYLTENKAKSI